MMKGVVAALLLAVVAISADQSCPSDWTQEKLLPHADCNKFYMCTYGEPVESACWGGLFFNVDTWQCDGPENVPCGDRNIPGHEHSTTAEPETEPTTAKPTTTKPTTAEPTTAKPTTAKPTTYEPTTVAVEQSCPSDWTQEKLLPHVDCNKFYTCTYGEPIEMSCFGDLFFNVDTWECDWPENVPCGDRNIPGHEPSTTAEPETAPTTAKPTTTKPTTAEPTTAKPTTAKPTTYEPTTVAAEQSCPSDWTQEKLLPHVDCNKFYTCTYGEPIEMSCFGDLFFNVDTWECDWPENVPCGDRNIPGHEPSTTAEPETEPTTAKPTTAKPTTTEPTTAKPTTAKPTTYEPTTIAIEQSCTSDWTQEKLLPHVDCNKFYTCTYGEPIEMSCFGDLFFNVDTWECDWPENVPCGDRNIPGHEPSTTAEPETAPTTAKPTTTKPTTAEPTTAKPTTAKPTTYEPTTVATEQSCPSDWTQEKLLPHVDCNKFYTCTYGEPIEMSCFGDLFFNVDTWECDWPENVYCGDRNIPGLSTTAHPETKPTTKPTTGKPTTAKPTTAKPTTEKPATPAPGFQENGCPVDPHVHWLLPVEGDCNGFYYCVWGELVLRACPATLHFNRELQVCTQPADAGCSTSVNKHNFGLYSLRF